MMLQFDQSLDFVVTLAEAPAIVRITVFFAIWLILWLPIAIPLAIHLQWRPPQSITATQKLPLLASLYALAPLVLWGAAAVSGSQDYPNIPLVFTSYGLPWNLTTLRSLGAGVGLGVLGLGLMFAIELALNWISSPPLFAKRSLSDLIQTLLLTLILSAWVSLTEELIFRGFLLNQLQPDFAPWESAAIASLIFALLHLVWEGQENLPQLPGLWLMGMVLVLARWCDGGNLGLAWGLHTGWIWTIASLDTLEAITYTRQTSEWITGWGNKPLAGVMGILFLLVTAGILRGLG